MFSVPTATELRGAASSAFTLSEAATRGIAKFLRAPFLQNTSEQLLAGQQKIDLCYIKSSFQIYQVSFLNKKLIEVFVYILN